MDDDFLRKYGKNDLPICEDIQPTFEYGKVLENGEYIPKYSKRWVRCVAGNTDMTPGFNVARGCYIDTIFVFTTAPQNLTITGVNMSGDVVTMVIDLNGAAATPSVIPVKCFFREVTCTLSAALTTGYVGISGVW